MKILDEMIKKIASDTVQKRGLEFFREGRIHIKTMDAGTVKAIADGEEIYSISIGIKDGEVGDYFCTCPYYQTMGSACRHIVATLKTCQNTISQASDYENENDRLATLLCREYSRLGTDKERINASFSLNISTKDKKFLVGIKAGLDQLEAVESGAFIRGLKRDGEAILSKHRKLDMASHEFGKDEAELIGILIESEENNRSDYRERGDFPIGERAFLRIMPILARLECEYKIDGVTYPDLRIIEDDPDILVDVGADTNRISLIVNERGTALSLSGEWFLFEGNIYRTSPEWQSWFMPIYNTVITAKRTQIDFVSANAVEFVTEVLPEIKGKRGVVLSGFEDVIVDATPEFEVLIQNHKNGLSAIPLVHYGTICLKLAGENAESDKILVRNQRKEAEIKGFFDGFEMVGDRFVSLDDEVIFDFLNNKLGTLKTFATVTYPEPIEVLEDLPIKVSVGYEKDINLLEVGFESTLSAEEVYGILESIKDNKTFFRKQDGSFFAPGIDTFSSIGLLHTLGFTKEDISRGKKQVSGNNVFYLAELKKKALIQGEESFDEFVNELESLKPEIPEHIDKVLRGYQRDGVRWLYQLSRYSFGGILADEMGLGKTLQVIAFVMSTKRELPALVVAPSSLTYNWQSEIAKFAPDATSVIIEGTKEERIRLLDEATDVDFIITSYPLMRRDMELYKKREFSYLFIDEAQYIKNPSTMNSKSVKKIKAGGYFALSGTPIENSLSELWSIFDFVMKGYLYSQKDFLARFQNKIMKSEDSGTISELRNKIQPFILRRMKKDVLKELPEKIENTVYAGLETEQKKMYEAYLKVARNEVSYMSEVGEENQMKILSLLMRLRQICCHPRLFDSSYKDESGKLQLFEELISSSISEGHRILVFSQFTSMLSIIRERLDGMGVSYFYLDGQTHAEERVELVNRFNKGERDVFLISLKAGGTGLNLVGADTVIHYDPWWNPAVMDQATDRAHRIGQKSRVQVIKLATKGTIEEQIIKLQEQKRALADDVIRENSRLLSGITKEEILAMLK